MKKLLKDKLEIVKRILERFPVFSLLTIFTTLFLVVTLGTNLINDIILTRALTFIAILASETLLIETKYYKGDFKKLVYCLGAAVIAGMLINFDIFNNPLNYIIKRIISTHITVCLLLSIHVLYKKSKQKFNEYITNVFINIFKVSIINSILVVAVCILGLIFNILIYESEYTIPKLIILVTGLFYIPNVVFSLVNFEKKEQNFFKALISYIFFAQLIISYVLVYAYIIKIIVMRRIPQNEVFSIISLLFVMQLFICTMVSYIKDNKVNRILPILFMPFILLQGYAIGIRIFEYGITPQRYMGLMLIAFEIIYGILYIVKKNKISNMFIYLSIIAIISGALPYINMYDISDYSQYRILKEYKKNNKLTVDDKIKIYGAYEYLDSSIGGKKYINKVLKQDDKITIYGYSSLINTEDNKTYISASKEISNINVKKYNNLQIFSISDNFSKGKKLEDEFKNITIEDSKVDILSKINEYIENSKDIDTYFENNNGIEVDKNTYIILNYVELEIENDKVYYYEIDGYLLKK